jgi:hypothetical protein
LAAVSGDDLVNAPTQTIDQALSGQFAGVNIRRNTGAPGGGVNVNLRGQSTLTGSTQPLYVVITLLINQVLMLLLLLQVLVVQDPKVNLQIVLVTSIPMM